MLLLRSTLGAFRALARSGWWKIVRQLETALAATLAAAPLVRTDAEIPDAARVAFALVIGFLVDAVLLPTYVGHQHDAYRAAGVEARDRPTAFRATFVCGLVALTAAVWIRLAAIVVGALPGLAVAYVAKVAHSDRLYLAARQIGAGGVIGGLLAASLATCFVQRLALLEDLRLADALRRSVAIIRRSPLATLGAHALLVVWAMAIVATQRMPLLFVVALAARLVRDVLLTGIVTLGSTRAAICESARTLVDVRGHAARATLTILILVAATTRADAAPTVSAPSGVGVVLPQGGEVKERGTEMERQGLRTLFDQANTALADAEAKGDARLVAERRARLVEIQDQILSAVNEGEYGTASRKWIDAKGTSQFIGGLVAGLPAGVRATASGASALVGATYDRITRRPLAPPRPLDPAAIRDARIRERERVLLTELSRIKDGARVSYVEGLWAAENAIGPLLLPEVPGWAVRSADPVRVTGEGDRVLLGTAPFVTAWRDGAAVKKEINGSELDDDLRTTLALDTIRLTNRVSEAVGGGVVPRMSWSGDRMIAQPFTDGRPFGALSVDAQGNALASMAELVKKAEATLADAHTTRGWTAKIDPRPETFRFDPKGAITSWPDPIVLVPPR